MDGREYPHLAAWQLLTRIWTIFDTHEFNELSKRHLAIGITIAGGGRVRAFDRLANSLNLHFNIPFTLPEDEADIIDSATNFGAGLLYGRNLAVGVGFVYGRFNQQEGIVTDESGPEPIGIFQPKVKSQFYSAVLKYTLQNLSSRFSPYGMLALGFLQRTYDPDLDDFDIEGFDDVDDETRFAFLIDLGIEVLVVSPVSLTLSLNYFKTSEADVNEDFGGSFLIVSEYLAVQVGTNLRL